MATKKAATKKSATKKTAAPKAPKVESIFTKGDPVVRVLVGGGGKSCTVGWKVKAITKGGVEIEGDDGESCSLRYDLNYGREIDPSIPGFYSEIIAVET